jgi:hypothetical protein
MRKRSSPKGLVSITPASPEAPRLEQTGPNTYALKGPDFDEELKKAIRWWRRFVKAHTEAGSASDDAPATANEASASDDVLDLTAAVKQVLNRLAVIELYSRDDGAAFYLYQGMLLASPVHQLAIVDNEVSICERVAKLESFSKGRMEANAKRKADASREHKKWQDEADRIQKERRRRGKKPLLAKPLAEEVRKNLNPARDVGTIRKQLKKPGRSGISH